MQRNAVWLSIALIVFLSGRVAGQNLVPNGNFETYQSCPRLDNQLQEAPPWYNPNRATPDFYHQCFQTGQVPLPPHSGQGVARLFFDQGWSEYLGVQLTRPLLANECYYAELYVATDTPNKYITETIGAYFSGQPITSATTDMFSIMPQTPQILDKLPKGSLTGLTWQRISGSFKAKGGEMYATIGSFYKAPPFLGFYYLFIDDISLVPIKLELGKDTTLCGHNSTLLLNGTTPGATKYYWSDGSTNPTLLVSRPGRYSVTAITSCKALTDSILIDYALDFDLGRDTTLCQNQPLALTVPVVPAASYRWQDGSTRNTFAVSQEGQYSVQVTQASCIAADTIRVRYILPPTLDLGPDKDLCGAETFTIKPAVSEGKFRWADDFTDTERTIGSSGTFRASVQNDCATVTDSIQISYGACDCILYAPTGFTPNNDGLNDVFLAYGCGDITITSLSIFDRWGEVIFKTNKVPFQWDGRYRGEFCPIGVYSWRIQYRLSTGKEVSLNQKTGTLTLVR